MTEVERIKQLLRLEPLPVEGGFFAETYRSADEIPAGVLDDRYPATRSVSTAIYYLLTPETFSALHRLRSDEIYHFYAGDPVEMLQLRPDGTGKVVVIGADVLVGMCPQVLVRHGVWQGSRLRPGGAYALMGTTVAPGYDPADFEIGEREALTAAYPRYADLIHALTH